MASAALDAFNEAIASLKLDEQTAAFVIAAAEDLYRGASKEGIEHVKLHLDATIADDSSSADERTRALVVKPIIDGLADLPGDAPQWAVLLAPEPDKGAELVEDAAPRVP